MKKNLQERIRAEFRSMSRSQRRLAVFLIEHWHEIPMLSIDVLSQRAGVSMATVTRFGKRFAFSGFHGLKSNLRADAIRRYIDPVDTFRHVKVKPAGIQQLQRVAAQDVASINSLLSNVTEEVFRKIVGMVENAQRVFCYGVGVSAILSRMIAYVFSQVHKESYCLDDGPLTIEERLLLTVTKRDLVLFSSFFPYSKSTIIFARLAHEAGYPILAITDNPHSPISVHADLTLAIPRENVLYTISIAAFSVLIHAIATEIALKKQKALSEAVRTVDRKLRSFYVRR